jgi:putative ABC transport system permease protein
MAPVAIVDEAFARQFFPGENPLGHHLSINPGDARAPQWSEIVGVVGNLKEYVGEWDTSPHIYQPFLAQPSATMSLVVRTRTDPVAFADSLRRVVWGVDKDQAVTWLISMDRFVEDAGGAAALMAKVMGAAAGLALIMAAIGIYGVIAYLVSLRTNEIGIRMALGARRSQVLHMVMRRHLPLVLAGVSIGSLISLALPRLVEAPSLVHTGWILAGTPLIITLVGSASCYIPARRATKVDPMVALRYE